MTGVIIQALNSVKNYISTSFGPGADRNRQQQQQQQAGINNFRAEGHRHTGRPLSRLFSFGSRGDNSSSRKRPAERLIEIELEITDDEDEDETPSWTGRKRGTNNYPKRLKPLEDIDEELAVDKNNMSDSNRKIPTRGSGIPPNIEGLDKQPWEFKFKANKQSKSKTLRKFLGGADESSASVEFSRGSLLKDATPSTSQQAYRRVVEQSDNPQSQRHVGSSSEASRSRMECMNKDLAKFRFNKPNTTQAKKEIEVVTLDDDNDQGNWRNDRKGIRAKNDFKVFQRKLKSPMKCKEKNQKPFSDFICSIGRKIVDPMKSTIDLEERNTYAELVKKFNSFKQPWGYGNSALQRSKLNTNEVQALYQKFPAGGTSPCVSFRTRFDSNFTSPLNSSTPKLLDRIAFENSRRLFSESHPSVPKPLALQMKPPVIDLENEGQDKLNGLSSSSPSTSVDESCVDLPLHSSFVDLNDALTSSFGPLAEQQESEKKDEELELLSESSSKLDSDSDIAILSESILNKSRKLNSLALEQTLSPYVNKGWLDGLTSSYRENEKARQKKIREHLETIDVIQKESTLETDLRERMRKKLTLTEIIVLEEPVPELPEITNQMREVIKFAKRPGRESEILATVFNIDVTRGDIASLAPCKWLNDNVINIYMELIAQRSKEISSYPNVHVFTTFFYPKLLKEGYSNILKRWTRKVDIFSNDLAIFPIHLGLHWCLACADFRDKTLKYYDSLGGRNDKCLNALFNYLASEMKERKGQVLNKSEWRLENVEEIPMQQNGSDCGVFSCKFAEYLSREASLTFLQENMNYYRERMIYEIIKKDLLFP